MKRSASQSPSVEQPVRVGFVLHVMQVAGAEMLVAETIRRLAGRIEAVVFCLDGIGPLGDQLRASGVPVLSFDRKPGRDWGVAVRMAREIRRRQIQVLHAHQYTPFFYSALARLLGGGRPALIFTEHGRHYPDVVGTGRRLLNRWALARLASEVNAVCQFSARALQAVDGFSKVPVAVIENGIDPERYGEFGGPVAARMRVGLPADRRYITTVARFHPVKDHATLISAFRALASAQQDVDLVLVGDGIRRAELEAQADQLGLTSRVRFLGVRHDVAAILAASTVFCLPSLSEAASLTLLEAMATALPVVVSDVGGNPEIVRHEQEGLLVPRQDPQRLAAALLRLLDDESLARRLGSAAQERVRSVYRLERTIERYADAYRRRALG